MNEPGDSGNATDLNRDIHWVEEDIFRLHGHLLEKSLHDLFDSRASTLTRAEILEWMQLPRDQSNAFSYLVCCRLFGLDPEDIRDRVLKHYRQSCTH